MLDDIKQHLARGEAETALRLLRPVAAQQPRSAEVQLCLSEAYFQLGAGTRAVAAAREAVRRAKRDPAAHYQLGRILSAQGQWGPAEAALQQALKYSPGYAPAQAELSRVRRALGRDEPSPVGPAQSASAGLPNPSSAPSQSRVAGARPQAGPRRPWPLALMSGLVLFSCVAIVFATFQPRWTGWQRQREPQPQETWQSQPRPQALPQPLPRPSAPQPQAVDSVPQPPPLRPQPARSVAQPGTGLLPAPQSPPSRSQISPSQPRPQAQLPAPAESSAGPRPQARPQPTPSGQNAGQPGESEGGRGGVLVACPLCGGSGWMVCPYCLISGNPKCPMCGGSKRVVCWFCGGKGQALWKNGEYVDTVNDHMPLETIPNEAIRQAVKRYLQTGKIPEGFEKEVKGVLEQMMKHRGDSP